MAFAVNHMWPIHDLKCPDYKHNSQIEQIKKNESSPSEPAQKVYKTWFGENTQSKKLEVFKDYSKIELLNVLIIQAVNHMPEEKKVVP